MGESGRHEEAARVALPARAICSSVMSSMSSLLELTCLLCERTFFCSLSIWQRQSHSLAYGNQGALYDLGTRIIYDTHNVFHREPTRSLMAEHAGQFGLVCVFWALSLGAVWLLLIWRHEWSLWVFRRRVESVWDMLSPRPKIKPHKIT